MEFLSSAAGGNNTPTDADAPPAPAGSQDAPVDPQSGMAVVDPEEQPC